MQKIKARRIPAIIGILLALTMMFGTGNVFASSTQSTNELRSIYVTRNYVQISVGTEVNIDVIACYQYNAGVVSSYCVWTANHENVVFIDHGTIIGTQPGVATITVTYGGLNAQIMVEVV